MKKYYPLLILVFILIITSSCSDTNKEPYQIPENAVELIAGTSGKTWKIAKRHNDGTRMNMAGCFLSYRNTYFPDMTVKDNNNKQRDCGPSLTADWEITKSKKGHYFIKLKSDQLPELMNIEENHKFFQITYLSKDSLQLRYRHAQFSGQVRTIVDLYVEEDITTPNRNFHNK
ncbi:Lipocalin-like domain-containing protein [Aquimarina amphilecti]|uniref:Lipocalin-like domain-containing protein n=1 Tax=Aquimarina amphilecti TaxID=1038014 RepID=A0A1H7WMM8_AQUAM|nr:lipocalin family protein [Aquimarina amphilecti]SEM22375.1 Lipocalin-like domain-containing protein [Aquimarina amphilecti]